MIEIEGIVISIDFPPKVFLKEVKVACGELYDSPHALPLSSIPASQESKVKEWETKAGRKTSV